MNKLAIRMLAKTVLSAAVRSFFSVPFFFFIFFFSLSFSSFFAEQRIEVQHQLFIKPISNLGKVYLPFFEQFSCFLR